MADFDRALAYVLRHEGGWSDHPRDPGGATNMGITLKTAQRHGIMTKDALKAMTRERAAEIYRRDYWRFGAVEDQRVATKLFDMSVNMGPGAADRLLYAALVRMGMEVNQDVGATAVWAHMLRAANAAPADRLLDCLCIEAAWRYMGIVERDPGKSVFLDGWLKRAAEVPNG